MKSYLAALLALALLLYLVDPGIRAQDRTETSIWAIEIDPIPKEPGKYAIRGSVFAIGDPVHETLTLHALINGGVAKAGAARTDASIVQYIRGVFWNDDPCAQLFTENNSDPLDPSFGVAWYLEFERARNAVSQGRRFGDIGCKLLARSHFGDLQFLHGMAERNNVKAHETLERVLAWASVTYRIAIGVLDARVPLEADPDAKRLRLALGNWTPMRLFRAKTLADTRARALGSLLHMIQDSFAGGHVARVPEGAPNAGAIRQFLSYVEQDTKKHAHDDSWSGGGDDFQRSIAVPGAREALSASIEIVRHYRTDTSWRTVESYLKTGPFRMLANAQDSGPGDYK